MNTLQLVLLCQDSVIFPAQSTDSPNLIYKHNVRFNFGLFLTAPCRLMFLFKTSWRKNFSHNVIRQNNQNIKQSGHSNIHLVLRSVHLLPGKREKNEIMCVWYSTESYLQDDCFSFYISGQINIFKKNNSVCVCGGVVLGVR